MTPPTPCQARRLAGWLLVITSTPVVPIGAQEFLPIIKTRAVDRVDERIQPSRLADRELTDDSSGKSGWNIALVVSAAYDDNIFLSATKPESDMVMVVIPEIAYAHGQANGDQGAFVRVAYRPAAVLYAEHNGESRIDHDLELALGWQGKAIALAYDGRFQRLGDATADTGAPTDRNEHASTVRVAWYPREKLAIEAAAGITGANYDSSVFLDSDGSFGEVVLRYAYSPKTQLGIGYRAGKLDIDGAGEQTIHRTTARFAWQPREKIKIDLEAGVEHRSHDLGSQSEPVAEGRVSWSPRAGTEVFVTGYLREEASAFFAGQNYQLGGATAGISESLGGGWTAVLEGGYERAAYRRVSGAGPAGRVDKILFVRPALEYELNDRFKAGLFYQYSRNTSNQPGFGYDDHQAGIQFQYQF